jgi:anti-sigma factor ChrR (cupin superfamily)
MKSRRLLLFLGILAAATGQSPSKAIVVNLDTAKWTHEKGAADDSEGVMLRTDPATGGMDLLVRFPAGHVIPPHFHDSNEHIIVVEGQLTLRQDSGEVQRLSCSSKTRCTFYLSWDGKPESHPAK